MKLGELINTVQLENVDIFHDEYEIDYATVVFLNKNTITDDGKAEWKDVLDSDVVLFKDDVLLVRGCKSSRLSAFEYALAGYCSEKNYAKWFRDEEIL